MIISKGASTGFIVLPLVTSSMLGQIFNLRNVGSGTITVYHGSNASPTAFIVLIGNTTYGTGAVDRFTITGGAARRVVCDGTYFVEF